VGAREADHPTVTRSLSPTARALVKIAATELTPRSLVRIVDPTERRLAVWSAVRTSDYLSARMAGMMSEVVPVQVTRIAAVRQPRSPGHRAA